MTLVLIHGSGSTPSLWDRVRSHLTGIPSYVVTLPGRENVQWPAGSDDRTVAAYGRAVMEAMDREGIDAATLAGHSLGGAIAMHLALEHPERVRGLGLVCTGARLRVLPAGLDAMREGTRDAIERAAATWCTPATPDRDRIAIRRMMESVGTMQTSIDLTACDGFDVMDRVSEIRCRTQIVGGEEDVLTPPKYSKYLAERIAGSRCVIETGAGHALPLERPEALAGDLAVLWAATTPRPTAGPAAATAPGR